MAAKHMETKPDLVRVFNAAIAKAAKRKWRKRTIPPPVKKRIMSRNSYAPL